jgi:RNA polymerase-interacting CarD/CdnL/TRCF family regulator
MEAIQTAETAVPYSPGDWLVHCTYGLGQIKALEVKCISGEETPYWRVKTADSIYWMPVEQMDSAIIRPLATPDEIEQAIAILGKPAKKMAANHTARKSRIQQVRSENSPQAIARLIRDLRARQRQKGILGQVERSAYGTLRQRLMEEWAAVTGAQMEWIAAQFEMLLNPGQAAGD